MSKVLDDKLRTGDIMEDGMKMVRRKAGGLLPPHIGMLAVSSCCKARACVAPRGCLLWR